MSWRAGVSCRLALCCCLLTSIHSASAQAAVPVPTPIVLTTELSSELKQLGLMTGAVPVAAFSWVIEQKRPLRASRRIREEFSAAPDGMSQVRSTIYLAEDTVQSRDYVSARGLLRFDASDKTAGVQFENFSLPLQAGQVFRLSLSRDDIPMNQSCRVADRQPAQQLHLGIRGSVWRLECQGDSRFAGMKVRIQSVLYFIEALGVFFNEQDDLFSPLGQFTMSQRILDFKISSTP
jgi:hypothetical protein